MEKIIAKLFLPWFPSFSRRSPLPEKFQNERTSWHRPEVDPQLVAARTDDSSACLNTERAVGSQKRKTSFENIFGKIFLEEFHVKRYWFFRSFYKSSIENWELCWRQRPLIPFSSIQTARGLNSSINVDDARCRLLFSLASTRFLLNIADKIYRTEKRKEILKELCIARSTKCRPFSLQKVLDLNGLKAIFLKIGIWWKEILLQINLVKVSLA